MTQTTQDFFLDGRLSLVQPIKGHRAGTDAALLAACAGHDMKGVLFDLGAGVGSAGLAIAARCPMLHVVLVEIDLPTAELAHQNIASNGLTDRVRVIEADIRNAGTPDAPYANAAGIADAVIFNPPFYQQGTVRPSPNPARRQAHQIEGDLSPWLKAAARLLKPRAPVFLIHRADALGAILEALAGRFGDARLKPVHAYAVEPATRLLVRAVKASRAGSTLLPPLVLHNHDKTFTPEAELLHRGRASINWLL